MTHVKLPKNCEVVPRCSVLSPCFVPGEVGVWLFGDNFCATGSAGVAPVASAYKMGKRRSSWLLRASGSAMSHGFPRFPKGFPQGFPHGFHGGSWQKYGYQVPSCWHWLLDTLAFRFAAFRASDSAAVGKCWEVFANFSKDQENSASVLGFRSLRRRFLFGERLQGNQASVDTANTARHALEGLAFAQDVAGGGFTLNIICTYLFVPFILFIPFIPHLLAHLNYNLPAILQILPTETAFQLGMRWDEAWLGLRC